MIAENLLKKWSANALWQTLNQVEQDLVISRALVCLYSDIHIKDSLVFRGGTALNKLFIKPAARYSEDIDFVQRRPGPIGMTLDKIRESLRPWLGEPKRKITERGVKLVYQYDAFEGPAKLKLEINTTEHFQVLPLRYEPFSVDSEWFRGSCEIVTYDLPELIATKMRALYQRRKGRDLFDLWHVFKEEMVELHQVASILQKYCDNDSIQFSKKLFQENMKEKRLNKDFQTDMDILLPLKTPWNFDQAFEFVQTQVIGQLPF